MPRNTDEESMNAPDPDPPCTQPKSTGNGGAGRVDPDGQMESKDDASDDLQVAKPKLKWNGKMEWTPMKRWATGQKAEMEQEDIDRELFEFACEWMAVSIVQAQEDSLPCCKGNRRCSVQAVSKAEGCDTCPIVSMPIEAQMWILAGIRKMEGADWMKVDRCCEHNANSHDEDKSKYLKYDAE
jgi:hypothetical protein